MSRIHDDRKDLYSREGVLTSTSSIRSIHTLSQSMEKEKIEKNAFGQHPFDTGFRTIDLIKPSVKVSQGRGIVPASLGSTQLHAMPQLMPSYISGSGHLINPVPINHNSLVRGSLSAGQHAFQTHIPINIGAHAPPRGSNTMSRSSLPSLKPTNLSNQIQIPGLPTILPPNVGNRTGSPIVTSHGLSSDSRLDSRTTLLSDPHRAIRGNIQASSQHAPQATIQVISSGTAAQQPHIPTSFLSKGMTLNTAPNMLKIGVNNAHSNPSSSTSIGTSAFKLGIGKTYQGTSSVIIPSTATSIKSDMQDIRQNSIAVTPYSRFSTSHNVTIPNHLIQPHTSVSTTNTVNVSTGTITNVDTRSHAVGVPFHPISAAYVFHDMGHPIGLHNFPHQLIRPPTTTVSALPMFAIDSQRVPTLPVASVPVSSKGNPTSDGHDITRTDGLTIHGNTAFNFPNNISNIYPNLQQTTFPTTFSSTVSTIESSARPSILRKRPAETATSFPVQPTEKERISSPLKLDSPANMLQTKMMSPPTLKSNEKITDLKPTNHSILSITSDLMVESMETTTSMMSDTPNSKTTTAPPVLLSSTLTNNINSNNNLPEASPKKKPRKQLIITTEDKYGSTAPINSCVTDEDEEFLKANETMKDVTPPKLSSAQLLLPLANSAHQKQLFSSPVSSTIDIKQEVKDIQLNGMITPTEAKTSDAMKFYIFRRRPQISIINDYKVNTKAANNHFYRYSDIRVKAEKKTGSQDRAISKSSMDSVSGWRLHHLSDQLEDAATLEEEICKEITQCKDSIPLPSNLSPLSNFQNDCPKLSSEDVQLRLLHELLQGNIQRCRYSMEQLYEAKETMFKILDYKPKAMDVMKKYKQKPRLKKKSL